MRVIKNISFLLLILSITKINAQLNASVIGDGVDLGNNCYIITPDAPFQAGGVWYDNPIDFDSDFSIYYQNNFGNKDANGADGMALVFKNNPTPVLGGSGGGLGYSGISPSLVIEFDTFTNGDLGDPSWDHIAIIRDGEPNHNNSTNLSGPVQASATSIDIEDGIDHEVRIEWNATTNVLNVFFDCILRLSLNENIKTSIFSGDDTVYFGFVGSTGGQTNLHQVCFNRISFVDNLQIDDVTICENEGIQVDATIPSGVTYNWTPTTGVSNPNIPDPVLSPITSSTYTVTIGDICGETITEELTVTVVPPSNTAPVFDPIPPICIGDTLSSLPTTSNDGVTGTWSPPLNNMMTTIYTFTPLPSECVIGTTLIIEVFPPDAPTFDAIEAVCPGAFIAPLPTTSINGFNGVWSPEINNMVTTTYTFTPLSGQCALETSLIIEILPPIIPIFNSVDPFCIGENIPALPTTSINGITGSWSPDINNMITTVYTFTPDTGVDCLTSTTLQITINPLTLPTFNPVDAVCIGGVIDDLPTISNEGIVGSWSPALNNMETTIYSFNPRPNQCASDGAIIQIQITPPSELTIDFDFLLEPFDYDQTVVINVNGGTGPYEYQINGTFWGEQNIINTRGCQEFVIRAREISGCSNTVEGNFRVLHYPDFFTPNGDGINETWNIKCLNDQELARIFIYDRFGKLLTVFNPSRSGWDGTYNGASMPSSDYWFRAEYFTRNGEPSVFNSHFTLKR